MAVESCSHYKRKCIFKSPCCDKLYPCRLCHDDEESHELNRQAVREVKCSQCSTLQEVSKNCKSCGILFGTYSCLHCNLFDDNLRGQFHCLKCGICRIGGEENYFHCNKCDMCLAISIQASHKCIEKISRRDCPICLEDLHTSRVPSHVPDCGHLLHRKCFDVMLKNGCYTCPTCNVCLVEMDGVWRQLDVEVAQTPMPLQFRNMKVAVLCRDCHETSVIAFHVVGLKCSHCGSYNTCQTDHNDEDVPIEERTATNVPVEDDPVE